MGHTLIKNLPILFNYLEEHEGFEFDELDDYINVIKDKSSYKTLWNWSLGDLQNSEHKVDDYHNVMARHDELYEEMYKIMKTFVIKYPRATEPYILNENLFFWDNCGGRVDRFFQSLTLADWKFSGRGLDYNMEHYKLNFGGYFKLLSENGHQVLLGEIVLPKITKCDFGCFDYYELKEHSEKWTDMYYKLKRRMYNFVEKGEFDQFPRLDPDECTYCFMGSACRILHMEEQEHSGLEIGEEIGDEPEV